MSLSTFGNLYLFIKIKTKIHAQQNNFTIKYWFIYVSELTATETYWYTSHIYVNFINIINHMPISDPCCLRCLPPPLYTALLKTRKSSKIFTKYPPCKNFGELFVNEVWRRFF